MLVQAGHVKAISSPLSITVLLSNTPASLKSPTTDNPTLMVGSRKPKHSPELCFLKWGSNIPDKCTNVPWGTRRK